MLPHKGRNRWGVLGFFYCLRSKSWTWSVKIFKVWSGFDFLVQFWQNYIFLEMDFGRCSNGHELRYHGVFTGSWGCDGYQIHGKCLNDEYVLFWCIFVSKKHFTMRKSSNFFFLTILFILERWTWSRDSCWMFIQKWSILWCHSCWKYWWFMDS